MTAGWNHTGWGDLWGDTSFDPRTFQQMRAGERTFSGNVYGHDPAISPLDFVIEREWLDDAACIDERKLFQKSANVTSRAAVVQAAKDVCASCLVRKACLDDAMEHETGTAAYRWGIRGGLNERERADLWREQQES